MDPLDCSYVIISPVRNEAKYIEHTLNSVVSQTIKPARWIIVNDGSTDDTAKIVRRYVERYPWIRLVNLDDQGTRERGGRVVKVFYAGFECIDVEYEFIVKLDGDLSFDPDYFEQVLDKFCKNPELGIAGGECYVPTGKTWRLEKSAPDHVRGPTKVYRRTCFEEMGGLPAVVGWDNIDVWRAQMKGWLTRGYTELRVRHYRPTGHGEGRLKGPMKHGRTAFFLGYPALAMVARCMYRAVVDRPVILAGLAMFWGYLTSWLEGNPQFADAELIAYNRRKQLRRLAFWRPKQ